ncbi:hypothetical protein GCM10020331_022560 [Ectobacillus funiculus]
MTNRVIFLTMKKIEYEYDGGPCEYQRRGHHKELGRMYINESHSHAWEEYDVEPV